MDLCVSNPVPTSSQGLDFLSQSYYLKSKGDMEQLCDRGVQVLTVMLTELLSLYGHRIRDVFSVYIT